VVNKCRTTMSGTKRRGLVSDVIADLVKSKTHFGPLSCQIYYCFPDKKSIKVKIYNYALCE